MNDISLRERLEKIINPFINSASQLAPCASSQANESFNYTVTTKHPKAQFYGGSESHCFSVALSVCQKNLGYPYIVHLNLQLDLSPGKHTERFRKRKQDICLYEAEKKKTIPTKRKRLEMKKERSHKNASTESREGVSYQSGSGYLNTSDLLDEVVIAGHYLLIVYCI